MDRVDRILSMERPLFYTYDIGNSSISVKYADKALHIQDKIHSLFDDIAAETCSNINISINFANSEELIKYIYSCEGYDILRTICGGTAKNELTTAYSKSIDSKGMFNKQKYNRESWYWNKFETWFTDKVGRNLNDLLIEGVPDFLFVKRSTPDTFEEFQFVEVKTDGCGLHDNQFAWMLKFGLPVRLIVVNNNANIYTTKYTRY